MLKARILTVLVLLPLFLAALFYLQDSYWAILLLGVTLIGAWEWSRLAAYSNKASWGYVVATFLIGMALFFGMSHRLFPSWNILLFGLATVFWVLLVPVWLALGRQEKRPLLLALAGWLVLIPTWLALVELRSISPALLLGLMGVVWVADSAAYFAGRRFGKHKLAPAISPGKTWEGVAGALLAVAVYGVLWRAIGHDSTPLLYSVTTPCLLIALMTLTGLSIQGDLFESWIKRCAGFKDSGHILPGHGGVLDRIDGLTSTLPIAAFAIALKSLLIPTHA